MTINVNVHHEGSRMNYGQRLLKKTGIKKVERAFLEAVLESYPQVADNRLVRGVGYVGYQFRDGGHQIDFVLIGEYARVAVEIDEDQHRWWRLRALDTQRDWDLIADGWEVVRFPASRVMKDAKGCVESAFATARRLNFTPEQPGPLVIDPPPNRVEHETVDDEERIEMVGGRYRSVGGPRYWQSASGVQGLGPDGRHPDVPNLLGITRGVWAIDTDLAEAEPCPS